jgi:hypothetical protein
MISRPAPVRPRPPHFWHWSCSHSTSAQAMIASSMVGLRLSFGSWSFFSMSRTAGRTRSRQPTLLAVLEAPQDGGQALFAARGKGERRDAIDGLLFEAPFHVGRVAGADHALFGGVEVCGHQRVNSMIRSTTRSSSLRS